MRTHRLDLSGTAPEELPTELARRRGEVGDESLVVRLAPGLARPQARAVLEGAGFALARTQRCGPDELRVRKAFTLPDFVRPDLRLLICGLNPSIYAAKAQIPFGRPGNRFWPAAQMAGLVERDRDVFDALRRGIGFSDLAKRATRRASELEPDEFRTGVARVAQMIDTYRPRAVCLVGLAGYRAVIDRRATAGWQGETLGGTPTYLMPSTSGLNAHIDTAGLAEHLARANTPPPLDRG